MDERLLIKNARIVLPQETLSGDLLIEKGKIIGIGSFEDDKAAMIIDAKNNYLIPGGIDAHVHFDLETALGRTADDFESGSKAAIAGGSTCIIDFITPGRNESLLSAFEKRKKQIHKISTDYSFHQSITHWDDKTALEMENTVFQQGITSFKTYLAYTSSIGIDLQTLEKVMRKAAELNAIVLIHSEDGQAIDRAITASDDTFANIGATHQNIHTAETEIAAILQVIEIAKKTQCKIYIVHLTTAEGIQAVKQAQKQGFEIYAETCPQYFVFSDEVYSDNNQAIHFMLSPPIRSEYHQKIIGMSAAKGDFHCINTDHCSFSEKAKEKAKKYSDIPQGISGVQYRLMLAHQHLIVDKGMSWQDFSKIISGHQAKLFNLPNKGKIEIGFDADLVLLQEIPQIKIKELTKDYSLSGENIYDDEVVSIAIDSVIKSGKIVFRNRGFTQTFCQGKYIKRH